VGAATEVATQRAHGRRHGLRIAGIVALLATLAPFSIDTYLPSFPEIGAELGGDTHALQLTLSLYLSGFAITTLIHGPLADRFGRRPVALGGLVIYILSSLICFSAQSMEMLYVGRIGQGISASAGIVIGRAMVRDAFSGAEAQRVMAQVMMLFALAPAIAPVIGGYLQEWWGWRAVFAFLVVLGLLLLLLIWIRLPETLPAAGRQTIHPLAVARTYGRVVRSGHFMALISSIALNFAGFFLFVAASPELLYRHLGYGADDFARLFLPVVVGLMAGAMVSGRLAGRLLPPQQVVLGYAIMALGWVLNLLQAYLLPAAAVTVIGPVVVYTCGMSIAMPSLTLLSLEHFPTHRGTASAVQTFAQTATNALVTALAVAWLAQSLTGLAWGQGGFMLAGIALWLVVGRSSMGRATG